MRRPHERTLSVDLEVGLLRMTQVADYLDETVVLGAHLQVEVLVLMRTAQLVLHGAGVLEVQESVSEWR